LLSLTGIACGMLVLITALTVEFGWVIHSIALVQISPDFSPMQFNTALCFIFCALNLVFFNSSSRFLKSLGLMAALFAFITLLEYVFSSNFGLDTLFIKPFTAANSTNIGRMAPNTCLNFIFMGSMLFTGAHFYRYYWVRVCLIVVTSIIIALTIVPLLAYLSGIQTAYPWKNLTGMAVHTAFCFIFLSLGVISQLWNHATEKAYVLLIPLLASLLTASFSMSGAINDYENVKYQALMKQEAYFNKYVKTNSGLPEPTFSQESVNRKSSYIANMVLILGLISAALITLTAYIHIKWRMNATALQESEERLHLAVTGTTDGLFDWDCAQEKFYFSPRFEEVLGYKPGELIPVYASFFHLIHPDDVGKFESNIAAQRQSADNSNMDFRLRQKSGKYLEINFRGTPSSNENGKVVRITGFISDLSIRNEMDRIKNEFISMVSHELRTPLTSIRGALSLVLGGTIGEITDKTEEFLLIASRNCDRLVRLINDILDIEKIQAGKMDFVIMNVNLGNLVHEAIVNNQMFAEKFGVRLAVEGVTEVMVNVDADRIMQVLTNLISNAVKFSKKNGVVTVSMEKRNKLVRVTIADTGIGIPEAYHYKIFQKFSQVDSSAVREQDGSGLGLNISKAIIEKLGGSLNFTSTFGVGSRFYFDLPIA
jgi:PAS domain S-box-containing protein